MCESIHAVILANIVKIGWRVINILFIRPKIRILQFLNKRDEVPNGKKQKNLQLTIKFRQLHRNATHFFFLI